MDRRRLVIAQVGPAAAIVVALLLCATVQSGWWPVAVLIATVLTAPLWPGAALRAAGSAPARADLVTAVNAHLTALVGYAIGAVLLLVFVGIFVFLVVLAGQLVFSGTAARRTWKGETVQSPPALIRFVH